MNPRKSALRSLEIAQFLVLPSQPTQRKSIALKLIARTTQEDPVPQFEALAFEQVVDIDIEGNDLSL